MRAAVRLVDVDDGVLDRLVEVAVTDAAPDEVTPPLSEGAAWTVERIAWLRAHHRGATPGEQTWAVVADGDVVGAVRLRSLPDSDLLETGIWLAWSARGRGIAAAAVAEVLQRAAGTGAAGVRANTASDNHRALSLLGRLGFSLEPDASGGVSARLSIRPDPV